jgi:hypothetical protein
MVFVYAKLYPSISKNLSGSFPPPTHTMGGRGIKGKDFGQEI